MKIQIFSDLHFDVVHCEVPAVVPDIDAVMVAGDVCEAAECGSAYLRQIVPMLVCFLLTLAEDRAETALSPAGIRVPHRSQPGGRP